jgi:hypothetical protein
LQAKIAGRCEAEPLGKLRRDGRERGWCGSGRRGRARFGAARPPRRLGGTLGVMPRAVGRPDVATLVAA